MIREIEEAPLLSPPLGEGLRRYGGTEVRGYENTPSREKPLLTSPRGGTLSGESFLAPTASKRLTPAPPSPEKKNVQH